VAIQGDFEFGTPLILRWLESLIFPGIGVADIQLHPIARAAWFGVLATALNLMPIGQLDGGHILYSLVGPWHRPLTFLFIAILIPMGLLFSYSWLLWALVLLLFARRHPRIYDDRPLGPGRKRLAFLSLLIFIGSFSLTPIRV
jgi:membrane-associated protease RseP (regulator of RpoE activity)